MRKMIDFEYAENDIGDCRYSGCNNDAVGELAISIDGSGAVCYRICLDHLREAKEVISDTINKLEELNKFEESQKSELEQKKRELFF